MRKVELARDSANGKVQGGAGHISHIYIYMYIYIYLSFSLARSLSLNIYKERGNRENGREIDRENEKERDTHS